MPEGKCIWAERANLLKFRNRHFSRRIQVNALPARLSEEGMKNLQAHLQRQKRGMKYLPETK
jgi:hypothetical protein